jgi:hypothetical protein
VSGRAILRSRDRSSSGMDAGSSGMVAPRVGCDADYTEDFVRLLGAAKGRAG